MKSYDVSIQMKPLQHCFLMVLLISIVVLLPFEFLDEILWCDLSNETSSAVLSVGAISYKDRQRNQKQSLGGK